MIRGPLPSCAGETQPPQNPSARVGTAGERGRGQRKRKEEQEKKKEGREGGLPGSDPQKKEGLESSRGGKKALPPSRSLPPPHTHTHTHRALVRCGYVAGLSGLLTGLPPFITAGSLVLLLGGTAALGTVSPTSCNDGSLYMATKERKQRNKRKDVSRGVFPALLSSPV